MICNTISTTVEKWGIEVLVHFVDEDLNIDKTKTFLFKDKTEVTADLESRIEKATARILEKHNEIVILDCDVVFKIKQHFKMNENLTKKDFETIANG